MIDALQTKPPTLRSGVLRTLKGVHLAFTGILTKRRSEAVRGSASRRRDHPWNAVGADYGGGAGRPNPLQAAGRDAGLKLMEIKRLRAKGQRITLLNEAQFWRLIAKRRSG